MNEENNNNQIEWGIVENSQLYTKVTENSYLHNTNDERLALRSIQPLSTLIINHGLRPEQIALQFTLNKSQKAVFMIIADHLDQRNRSSSGKPKRKGNVQKAFHFGT